MAEWTSTPGRSLDNDNLRDALMTVPSGWISTLKQAFNNAAQEFTTAYREEMKASLPETRAILTQAPPQKQPPVRKSFEALA